MVNTLLPTYLEVKCKCGKIVNVRTTEQEKDTHCWNCARVIHVHLGSGRNNLSVTIEGEKVIPNQVYQ